MELSQLVEWAKAAFPYIGDSVAEHENDELTSLGKSALNVALAYETFDQGTYSLQVLLRLANGLNGLGLHLREQGNTDAARKTFGNVIMALRAIAPADQTDYGKKVMGFAFANFKQLGGSQFSVSATPEEPYCDLTPILQGIFFANNPNPPTEDTDFAKPSLKQEPGARPGCATDLIQQLRLSWAEELDKDEARRCLSGLRDYFGSHFDGSEQLPMNLKACLEDDSERIISVCGLISLPTRIADLQKAARDFRTFAYDSGANPLERRMRWLIAALMNYKLLNMPDGLSTNAAQVHIDLMGYVAAISADHRYIDRDRDLLLDCAEAEVRLGFATAPVVVRQFEFVRSWILACIGTYLILSGPNPSRPSDSYYDERIQSDRMPSDRGLRRTNRSDWPEMLLQQWQPQDETAEAACFALASLAGWEPVRSDWVVDLIFNESIDEQRNLSIAFWKNRLHDLLARVQRVRIATNPWNSAEPTGSRGTMISSDASGRFIIPNGLLRASVAHGLVQGDASTVQGHLFKGRRIPTYLLSNRFGAYAILKIDYRDKILREVRNFDLYAKRRLHPSHRPSECVAQAMDMYQGEDGAALRAISTSYIFDEGDKPLTLGTWLRTAEPALAADTIRQFLLGSLRPWLAHVRRDRIDIRSEYPAIRPTPVVEKQQSENWVKSEIEKLKRSDVLDDIGVALSDKIRDCPWFDSLPGTDTIKAAGVLPETLVNPLWLASELAETGVGELSGIIDDQQLRDFDTLLCISHGDLHCDNILCASVMPNTCPRTVLIDFESTHEGHVCKDLARLEASLLVQVFEGIADSVLGAISKWFAESVRSGQVFSQQPVDSAGRETHLMTLSSAQLRRTAQQCGQGLWPIREEEYLLALFASLLPMVRWTTISRQQKRLALIFTTVAGSALLDRWLNPKM